MKIKASKRYKKLLDNSKDKKAETIENAIKKTKQNCTTKFDESIDVSFFLNLKQKKEEFSLRTIVNLPNGNGKKIKVAVLCEDSKIKENFDSLIQSIYKEKPSGLKGDFILSAFLTSTMGVSYKLKVGK